VWQSFNALFILRVCAKYFLEKLKEEDVLRQFDAIPKDSQGNDETKEEKENEDEAGDRMELLIQALIDIIVDLPLT
jgi:hypothetical protein